MNDKPIRLADTDRAEAADVLLAHFEDGRLDALEHEERTSAAWSARFADDLAPLFADLPAPHPSSLTGVHLPVDWNTRRPPVVVPRSRSAGQLIGATSVLALLAALLVVVVLTGSWWLIAVAGGIYFCAMKSRR